MSKSTHILLVMGALVVLGGMSPLNAEIISTPQAKSNVEEQGGSMNVGCPDGYTWQCHPSYTGATCKCVPNN